MGLRPTSPTRPITPDVYTKAPSPGSGIWQKWNYFLGNDSAPHRPRSEQDVMSVPSMAATAPKRSDAGARPVGVGLPRQTTFKRQNSEKRERLCPAPEPASSVKRRAFSVSQVVGRCSTGLRSTSSPAPSHLARNSAPALANSHAVDDSSVQTAADAVPDGEDILSVSATEDQPSSGRQPRPTSVTSSNESYERQRDSVDQRAQLNAELDSRWILNLSMHFRDKSDREKFFVTYAERPNKWRRVTVSVDYRNAELESLEMDLKELTYQRDKSLQIYEAIRDSLPEIQFYDTVTNLKLETSEGRLHVHVTEDVNEIIPYPPRTSLAHVLDYGPHRPMACRESDIAFEAHLSGFVYRVRYKGRVLIKKEIPGPDTVDEFLYEVNALNSLTDSNHVIRLEGIVLDDTYTTVKGLLISLAEKGAVVDLLYDHKGEIPWERRERWARHAVTGLRDIHEEGYVQGDFTLSNIVVDARDNARIIDINRRGCPVGWEPPELAQKIASNQRISMYIGQKSDLYQLGMSLWALAMDDDEPERHDPPLSTQAFPAEVPSWFAEIVRVCLSPQPRDRLSAKTLVDMFVLPPSETALPSHLETSAAHARTPRQYIHPEAAVERDDLEKFRHECDDSTAHRYSPQSSREDYSFTYPHSSNHDHDYDGTSSDFERPRGRRRLTDHDLMLRAQSREHANAVEDEQDDDAIPIIGHIARPATLPPLADGEDEYDYFRRDWRTEEPYERVDGNVTGEGSSNVDTTLVHPTDGSTGQHEVRNGEGRYRDISEASEATPKTSTLQLVTGPTASPGGSPESEQVDSDLAHMGSHPNIRPADSAADIAPRRTDGPENALVEFLPRRLRFVDSGFTEPEFLDLPEHTHEPTTRCEEPERSTTFPQTTKGDTSSQEAQPPAETGHDCSDSRAPFIEEDGEKGQDGIDVIEAPAKKELGKSAEVPAESTNVIPQQQQQQPVEMMLISSSPTMNSQATAPQP